METLHDFKVGDKVTANGYPGTIVALCEWSDSMVEVRLASGTVCIDGCDSRSIKRAS